MLINSPIGSLQINPILVLFNQLNGILRFFKINYSWTTFLKPTELSSLQINPDLDPITRSSLIAMIERYSHLFQWDLRTDLGRTRRVTFDIDTGDAAPIRQQQFPHPQKIHDKIKTHVDEMSKLEVIKPIDSEWSSPCFLAPKKNPSGEWVPHARFVIDVRGLNSVTKKIS
jgi:hypothetical protein